jgi:glycosyltransferase involved in cell wall biosynthesis
VVDAAENGLTPTSIGFVGTYPPTRCGIATFNASLRTAIAPARSGICALVDAEGPVSREEVVAQLVRGSRGSRRAAAAALNDFDVVIVQHEFGIYGGRNGREALAIVRAIGPPVILVAHTVLWSPTTGQRRLFERLAEASAAVVAPSSTAREYLLDRHDIPPGHVTVIPHGAPANASPPPVRDGSRRPVILTWGLLGRSKGIEFGIEALAHLRDLEPAPRYVIHGETHPGVVAHEGQAYRESLLERARSLGVANLVELEDGYLESESLLAAVREADVVLLPYRSRAQVVSGVLAEAVAAGRPVVATPFPHAVELLGGGAGILVPYEDGNAIASALRLLLTDAAAAGQAAAAARAQAPSLLWEAAGRSYASLAESLVSGA